MSISFTVTVPSECVTIALLFLRSAWQNPDVCISCTAYMPNIQVNIYPTHEILNAPEVGELQ